MKIKIRVNGCNSLLFAKKNINAKVFILKIAKRKANKEYMFKREQTHGKKAQRNVKTRKQDVFSRDNTGKPP